jgi:nucleoside-diphosphate-sugar epimerase
VNVLVAGASGYFGGALVPQLVAAGHRVTSVGREAKGDDAIAVDLRDREATRRALGEWRWDAVINLAGPAPKSIPEWSAAVEIVQAHVAIAVHLVAACPADWRGRFVQASGMIAYGMPETDPVTEAHPRRPLHPYALAKALSEDVVLGSGLRDRWVLRLGGLFSESRRSGAMFAFARAAKAGEPIRVTCPPPVVPWETVHVEDAASSVVRAVTAGAVDPGAVNVGYGERIHIVEIAQWFADRSGGRTSVTLEGESPPAFRADSTKARHLGIAPEAQLADRLAGIWNAA